MIKKLLFSIGCMVLLIITCCSSSTDTPVPAIKKRLTIMTYNIHHGAPANPDIINLNNIADVIRKSGAEIIALQEVDVNTDRSNQIDQAKELAKLLDMNYYFSKSIDYRNGDYGNAILSKYPISNKRSFELPMTVPGEKRSIALATIQLPNGKTIEFGSTHFDLKDSRIDQAKFLNQLSIESKKPMIIGGDYNATPDSEEMIILKKEVNSPTKAIDFIVYNDLIKKEFTFVSGIAMAGQYASDHLPVVAVFEY